MALGLVGRLTVLEREFSPRYRYSDISIQFAAYERLEEKFLRYTGQCSPIYGGKYDTWQGKYVCPADSQNIIIAPCSIAQLNYILDDKSIVEAAGGRGSGKSDGGVLRMLRHIVEFPQVDGRVLSPTYDLVDIVWQKCLQRVPRAWLKEGREGIKRDDKELHFIHDVTVQFASAHNPDALRSWGGAWTFADEGQDISTEALDINWFCLRCTDSPRLWLSLTPKTGEPFQRHKDYAEDEDATCLEFGSYTNCFISKRVFDLAKKRMDKTRYSIEVDANWETVAKLEEEEGPKYVFAKFFNHEQHTVSLPLDPELWPDITETKISKKIRAPQGKRWRFVVGVDANTDYPNYATVFKAYAPRKPGYPIRWVAIKVIAKMGHCGHLAQELKRQGFGPRSTLIVPDASCAYNAQIEGKRKKTPVRLMRAEGYTVFVRRKNPSVSDTVDSILAKLDPVEGEPSFFIANPDADELIEAFEQAFWDKNTGTKIDKSLGVDHVLDCARYVIHLFEPAAFDQTSKTRGYRLAA